MTTKETIIETLDAFIRQRPGLEFGNYGDVKSWRSEMREITRDLHHARELLRAVGRRDSITADDILRAGATGRLTLTQQEHGVRLDYCIGQYFPTEYRPAVCRLLSSVLWDYWRDCMDEPTGDKIRAEARRSLSRSVARRWFN